MDEELLYEEEVTQTFKDVYKIVEQVLKDNPLTRNHDDVLRRTVWKQHGDYINGSTIERVRREIQNKQGKLLPTVPGILIKRRIKELHIRRYYSNNKILVDDWQKLRYDIQ